MLIATAILWMVPMSDAVTDFRTDAREDDFSVNTAVGVTSANVVLVKSLYDNDTNLISFNSTLSETPTFSSYNSTTKQVNVATLTANTSRTLTVFYRTDALPDSTGINTMLDWWYYIWILLLIAFPIAAIVAIIWR